LGTHGGEEFGGPKVFFWWRYIYIYIYLYIYILPFVVVVFFCSFWKENKSAEMSNWTLALKWWKKVGKMTLLVISIGRKGVKLRMDDDIIVTDLGYVSFCGL